MAKPKVDTIVKVLNSEMIRVYCDDLNLAHREVTSVEGIISAMTLASVGCLHALIDPRYDIQELRDEIEGLLKAEVPDVFKE